MDRAIRFKYRRGFPLKLLLLALLPIAIVTAVAFAWLARPGFEGPPLTAKPKGPEGVTVIAGGKIVSGHCPPVRFRYSTATRSAFAGSSIG
jgi:hypothetical protein